MRKSPWIWRFQVLGPLGEKHLSREVETGFGSR